MNRQMPTSNSLATLLQRTCLASGIGLISALGICGTALYAQTPDTTGEAPAPIESAPAPAIAPPVPVPPSETMSVPPAASSNEPYIDSTNYSIGATQRSRDLSPAAAGLSRVQLPNAPTSVQVGPINLNSYGMGIGSLPTVRDFYRQTLRPPGRLGNGDIRLIFPLAIPAPITSLFGWRIHPIDGNPRFHSGTDLGAPIGTPVLAAYAGRVIMADFLGGYGLAVALDHNKGSQQTLYGHLSEIFVQPGEQVKQGTVIGRVGDTGNSTGPHLHFEFRQLTPDGWVAMDAGGQLEYALAELVRIMEVSEKGIANAKGVRVSQQGQAGISGEIEWQATVQPKDPG